MRATNSGRITGIALLLATMLSIRAFADTHYVSLTGSNSAPYTTWATAATNAQTAINAASSGDTVFVTNGVYTVATQIVIANGITFQSVNGAAVTKLSGAGLTRVVYINHTNAVLQGFTIENGLGPGGGDYGGGVRVYPGLAVNCVIKGNRDPDCGGGASVYWGGELRGCLIYGNAAGWGAGVYSVGGYIVNCTVVSNSASSNGGGVCTDSDTTISRNTIVYHNSGNNTYISSGALVYDYSCTYPLPSGVGNISNNPALVYIQTNNCRLKASSPCINSGTNLAWMGTAADLDGNARIYVSRVDIGAYEYTSVPTPFVDITNASQTVSYDITSCAISGTNNAFVVGGMRWTNSLTTGNGTLAASSSWTISGISIGVGTNIITVFGTNAWNQQTNDSVTFTRGGIGTGVPFLDITNVSQTVSYDVITCNIGGTNNPHVVGGMWVSNVTVGGATQTFAASASWTAPAMSLAVGQNMISVYGTNALGVVASDNVAIIRLALNGMALIPAGSFSMGDTFGEGDAAELPVHTVMVSAFYMDKCEVTYTQWTNVHAWAIAHSYTFDDAGAGKTTNHPVQTVNWYDCVKWCNARSEMVGSTPCYYTTSSFIATNIYRTGQVDLSNEWVNWSANGYRLPTEAEWEKAARGGTPGHRFPWNDVDIIQHARANYNATPGTPAYDTSPTSGYHPTFAVDGIPYTSPVNYFAPNDYGLCDMAGNVWEWIWDWYGSTYYSVSPGSDPQGPPNGTDRCLRGGAWYGTASYRRCAFRGHFMTWAPGNGADDFGFRCARRLETEASPFIDITNALVTVANDITSYTVAGTNNPYVVGGMVWSNSLTVAGGAFSASVSWQISGISLGVGANVITVYGTNTAGAMAGDSVTITRASATSVLTNGLVAWYPFNGNANDESGYGRTGTVCGAVLTNDMFGIPCSAYYFNGTDLYIRASANNLPTTNRTVAFWFYAVNATGNVGRGLLGYGGGASCGYSFNCLMNNQDSGQNQYETQGHGRINRLDAPMSTNAVGMWHHWAITVNGNLITMFIDGMPIGSGAVFTTATGVAGKDLIIGTIPPPDGIGPYSDGNTSYFVGILDDIRIYKRCLSESEIEFLVSEEPSTGVPFIDITNTPQTVSYDVTYCKIGGTNNAYLVGGMWVSNATVGGVAQSFSSTSSWTAPTVPLALGANVILVYGSNAVGAISSDRVDIWRHTIDGSGVGSIYGRRLCGSLIAWGETGGGTTNSPAGDNYVAIAGGIPSTALRNDGTLVAWGDNTYGQINCPAGSNYVAIAVGVGGNHSLALRDNGTLVDWGDNTYGQTNCPAGTNYIAVAAGVHHSLALQRDGTLAGWGRNNYGQTNCPAGNDYVAVAAGSYNNIALRKDGTLVGWGYNSNGQTNCPAGNDYVAIAGGGEYCVVLRRNGSLLAWGWNAYGQTNCPAGTNYVAISANYYHALALRNDATMAAWGRNDKGQSNSQAGSNYIAVAAGCYHSIAMRLASSLPFVDITNVPQTVPFDVASCTICGTNNAFVVGAMRWTNSLTGGNGVLPATSGWTISGISLGVGTNIITVYGTNAWNQQTNDSVAITRKQQEDDLTNALIAWYPFNGNANDESGNEHTGTVVGAVLTGDRFGTANSAYSFDGVDDIINVADSPAFTLGTQDFSIALWINYKSVQNDQRSLMGHDQGSGNVPKWSVTLSSYVLWFHVYNGINNYLPAYAWTPQSNCWYHLAFTRSSTLFATYVNGIAVASTNSTADIPDMNAMLTIGGAEALRSPVIIDDVRLYRRCLGTSEIGVLVAGCPYVDITNAVATVANSVTNYAVAGTNNVYVVGGMRWTNSVTGGNGMLAATSSWTISGISLGVGTNIITVFGTNAWSQQASDSVVITRQASSGTMGSNWICATSSSMWNPRQYHTAIEFNGKLTLCAGLLSSGVPTNDVWQSTDGSNWTVISRGAPWTKRYVYETLVFSNKMWVIGGYNGSSAMADVWSSFDGSNWACVTGSANWPARSQHKCVVHAGRMWILGGNGGGNDVWSSTDGSNWTMVTAHAPWSDRYAHGAAAWRGRMWVVGGYDGAARNDVWSSVDGTNWTMETSAAAWGARMLDRGLVAVDDKLWLIAGRTPGSNAGWSDVWWTINGVQWIQATASAPWQARSSVACASFNNRLWLTGGNRDGAGLQNDTWYSQIGDALPVIVITTMIESVSWDMTSVVVAGTNNAYVFGGMRWTNSLTGGNGVLAATSSWTISGISLSMGTNIITVFGTNAWNQQTNDSITITRGGIGTGTPFVNITNVDSIVSYDILAVTIGGTNNPHVVGGMRWTNSLTGGNGVLAATSSWTISGISLGVGTNIITVYGTNAWNQPANDSVSIARGGTGTGTPYVDITNVSQTVSYNVITYSIGGTNNAHAVGGMRWTNSITGGNGVFAATSAWTISGISLGVGTNLITVFGTNTWNQQTNDSVTITRGGIGTGTPFVNITNVDSTVSYDVLSVSIGGTNNPHVVGGMRWTNSLTGGNGILAATSSWTISGISLGIGTNIITVYGTNAWYQQTNDCITITRGGIGTGMPFVNITNIDSTVSYDVLSTTIGGTNNPHVVGSMWWTNSLTRASGSLTTYDFGFTISDCALAPGANVITVYGSNLWSQSTGDTVTITRLPRPIYPTGMRVNNQVPAAWIPTSSSVFSWHPSEGGNSNSPAEMLRGQLGSAVDDATYAVAVGDVTGDGLPDIAVANYYEQNYVLVNNGGSPDTWSRVALSSDLADFTIAIAIGDLTGDGQPDIVVGNDYEQNYVMVNNGGSPDTWARVALGSPLDDGTYSIAIGDLTGDGRADVVVGNYGEQNYVLVNNGGSPDTWSRADLGSPLDDATASIVIGDVTGDRLADVVVGNYGEQNYVVINDGSGDPSSFARVTLGSTLNDATLSIDLGDLTGDGRLDVAVGNYMEPSYVLVNNGGTPAGWSRTPLGTTPAQPVCDVAIGDVTGDGLPDAVIGNEYTQNCVVVNTGMAPTNWPWISLGGPADDATYGVAIGDVTGDGRVDVVLGNLYEQNCVVRNGAASMPCAQAGYRIQVGRTEAQLADGTNLYWDSDWTNSTVMGDGCTTVGQAIEFDRGVHTNCWRVRVVTTGGETSAWSMAQAFVTVFNGPTVVITNAPQAMVSYDIATYTLAGTNNSLVVGGMWVSNAANAAVAQFEASTSWTAAAIPLGVGQNEITVYGTNASGSVAYDRAAITRGPVGTGTPFLDITNEDIVIGYDVSSCSVSGTNNQHVVGRLWWTNVCGTGVSPVSGTLPATGSWSISAIPLAVGANAFVVSGTNAWNVECTDTVTVTRGGIGTGMPFVDITNEATIVGNDTLFTSLSGTNNVHVAGGMWVSNGANCVTVAMDASASWTTPAIDLVVGNNDIWVWGTNAWGVLTNDCMVVTRGPMGTGTPFVDLTNVPSIVSHDVVDCTVSGTNNVHVVGDMWVSNEVTGAAQVFPATDGWTAPAISLAVGDNVLSVHGTNALGMEASDSIIIARGPVGTGMPFVDITNNPATVGNDVACASISGTNNEHVVGGMWASNTANAVVVQLAATPSWMTVAVPLVVGPNRIDMHGTNVFGALAVDSLVVTRGPVGTGVPFVDATNEPVIVSHDVTEYIVSGTNNIQVAGTMWVTNETTGDAHTFAASDAWTAPQVSLAVGLNLIAVHGTNALGASASDLVLITRGPAGTGMPFVDITNEAASVTYENGSTALCGTNNIHVVGQMWVSNCMNVSVAVFDATASWTTPDISLAVGVNDIRVYGTNAWGAVTTDMVTITREPMGTGTPFVDVTNETATVSFDIALYQLSGTNGAHVVGGMWATNETTGEAQAFPAAPSWTSPQLGIAVGANLIVIYGTNAFGSIATDTVVIVRGPVGTGTPFVDITNITFAVAYDKDTCAFVGTNNAHVVGNMWVSNATAGGAATSVGRTGLAFAAPGIPLWIGVNVVRVYSSNSLGSVFSDSITIWRYNMDGSGQQSGSIFGRRMLGTLVAWGNTGALMNLPSGDNYVGVTAGLSNSLAMRDNGTLVAWGYNGYGQTNCPTGSNYVAIVSGFYHCIAIRNDGTLVGWGSSWDGQTNCPIGNNYVAVSASGRHSLALRSDGTLVAWGNNQDGLTDCPAGSNYVAIASGYNHSVALCSDGTLVAWGNNDYGQTNCPPGNNYVAIAAGGSATTIFGHSLALRSDGTLVAWGNNSYAPTNCPAGSNYVSVAAGSMHSIALRNDDTIIAWGTNAFGQTNCPTDKLYVGMAAGGFHSVAITVPLRLNITNDAACVTYDVSTHTIGGALSSLTDITNQIVGTMWWTNRNNGANGSLHAAKTWTIDDVALSLGANLIAVYGTNALGMISSDSISIWRYNVDGSGEQAGSIYGRRFPGAVIGWGKNTSRQTNCPPGHDYVAVAAGMNHSLALRTNGTLVGWGLTNYVPAGSNYVAVVAGNSNSLALRNDGRIVGWGTSWYGLTNCPAGSNYIAVAAGFRHALALRKDGTLVAWGTNWYGLTNCPAGSSYVAIAAGYYHSLALRRDGSIVQWGYSTNVPSGNNYVAVAAGIWGNSHALRNDGVVIGWGGGSTDFPSSSNYVAVAEGAEDNGSHSLALRNDGTLVDWGNNNYGLTNYPKGNNYIAIAAGGGHSLSIANVTPFVDITNVAAVVSYNLTTYKIAGTNTPLTNAINNVTGSMWWTNNLNGAKGTFPATQSWTIADISIGVGTNTIVVYGTNLLGWICSDSIAIMRGGIGTAMPFLDVTNESVALPNDTLTCVVAGTNNIHVVGRMWVTNILMGGASTSFVAVTPWTTPTMLLGVGANTITIFGTNTYGVVVSDSVVINRGAFGTGTPFLNLTNTDMWVANDVLSCAIGGSNNAQVVGGMVWSNELTGASGVLDASPTWAIGGIALDVGANTINVRGTNMFGDVASDSVVVTRGPIGTGTPYVDATNMPVTVPNDVYVHSVSGTNNEQVVGGMWVSNSLTGGIRISFAAAAAWTTPSISLNVGTNSIVVYGTNAFGVAKADTVTVTRLVIGTGTPFVDVTNMPASVPNDVVTCTVAGTNNAQVVGWLRWTNALNSASGTIPVSSFAFQVSTIPLAVGANPIIVVGTNAYGVVCADTVAVTRLEAGTGTPFVDITNAPLTVADYVSGCTVAGTNNVQVVGGMWVSNSVGGGSLTSFTAATSWLAPQVPLAYGTNLLVVGGTNAFGAPSTDTVLVERAGAGTPYVNITNTTMTVPNDVTAIPVAGVNNMHVVGGMWAINASIGEQADFLSAPGWVTPALNLKAGINQIYAYGTNIFGDEVYDVVFVTRGPAGTGAPFVDLTNASMVVANDVSQFPVAGTNNAQVVGGMRVTNETVGGASVVFAADPTWVAPSVGIAVGDNVVRVTGTNVYGAPSSDTVTITRGPVGTGTPFIDITNADAFVTYDTSSSSIAGTNNEQVVGRLTWTNGLNGAAGSLQVSSFEFQVSSVPLSVGANAIVVSGTNALGAVATDNVTITRGAVGTGVPFVDATNSTATVPNDVTTYAVAGTNNAQVVGWMRVSNGMNSVVAQFPAQNAWIAPAVQLTEGTNELWVVGTNALGAIASDTVVVTRGPVGTGTPFVDVTNTATWVANDIVATTIAGTNNCQVVGSLTWSNAHSGIGGSVAVAGAAFQIAVVGLGAGSNTIVVSGTNVHGVMAEDSVQLIRGPVGTGTPFVDLTNTAFWIANDAATCAIGGTNNAQVVGWLAWSNSLNGAAGAISVSSFAFQINGIPLAVGSNTLAIWGTNAFGIVSSDSVIATRGPVGTGAPFVDATNDAIWVVNDVAAIAVAGTNNIQVVGGMRVTNETAGGAAIGFAASAVWTTPSIGLIVGANSIKVIGTNMYGMISSDTVVVTRGPVGTGTPFIDVTNSPMTVGNHLASFAVSGTNNAQVVGMMWATNETIGGAAQMCAASPGWTSPAVDIADGGNLIVVRGTNAYGFLSSDSVVITRESPGTNGVWINAGGGSWTNAANWSGGIASGRNALADISTLNITGNRIITLDGSRTIGHVKVADTTPNRDWTIASGTPSGNLRLSVSIGMPTINVINQTLTVGTTIEGGDGLCKAGSGTLSLSVANMFAGPTVVSNGILKLASANALWQSWLLDVAAGATVDVNNVSGFAIGAAQMLKGMGTIMGIVSVSGTNAPGSTDLGTLTVSGSVTMVGNAVTIMRINPGAATNADRLSVISSLAIAGALKVGNIGADASVGESFNLFDASTIGGTFSTVTLPTLGSGKGWITSNLYTTGIISVADLRSPADVDQFAAGLGTEYGQVSLSWSNYTATVLCCTNRQYATNWASWFVLTNNVAAPWTHADATNFAAAYYRIVSGTFTSRYDVGKFDVLIAAGSVSWLSFPFDVQLGCDVLSEWFGQQLSARPYAGFNYPSLQRQNSPGGTIVNSDYYADSGTTNWHPNSTIVANAGYVLFLPSDHGPVRVTGIGMVQTNNVTVQLPYNSVPWIGLSYPLSLDMRHSSLADLFVPAKLYSEFNYDFIDSQATPGGPIWYAEYYIDNWGSGTTNFFPSTTGADILDSGKAYLLFFSTSRTGSGVWHCTRPY